MLYGERRQRNGRRENGSRHDKPYNPSGDHSRIACRRRKRSGRTTDYRWPNLPPFAANSAGGSFRKNWHGQLDAITTATVLHTCEIVRSKFSARADPNLVGRISF
jgi:hypothetical protein